MQPPAAEPRPGLEVARLGGGRSARAGALVVGAILVAIVWVGMSARPAAPPPESPQLAVAEPAEMATSRPTPPPPSTYDVSATIGDRRYAAVLDELQPGHLSATLRVPIPVGKSLGTLDMTQLRMGGLDDNPILVEQWALPLDPLMATTRDPELVIDSAMPARPQARDAPAALRSGFRLTVYAENDLLFGILSIEILLVS
jgi:hypothetical protein